MSLARMFGVLLLTLTRGAFVDRDAETWISVGAQVDCSVLNSDVDLLKCNRTRSMKVLTSLSHTAPCSLELVDVP